MTREQADLLMAELAAKLQVPGLALDASGAVALSVDATTPLRIRHDRQTGDILLSAALVGVAATPAQQARALSACFCWTGADGAVFGLDRGSGQLVLQRHCPGASLDIDGLTDVLESLINHAEAWTKLLGEIMDEPAEHAGRPIRGGPVQTA
jgi:hypothetical protein